MLRKRACFPQKTLKSAKPSFQTKFSRLSPTFQFLKFPNYKTIQASKSEIPTLATTHIQIQEICKNKHNCQNSLNSCTQSKVIKQVGNNMVEG